MTSRLVGLISVVLLLSLGLVAALLEHHHDRFMSELERTVSQVGRETLRTFVFAQDMSFTTAAPPQQPADTPEQGAEPHRVLIRMQREVEAGTGAGDAETPGTSGSAYAWVQHDHAPGLIALDSGCAPQADDCEVTVQTQPGPDGSMTHVVRLEQVSTQRLQDDALVLRFPVGPSIATAPTHPDHDSTSDVSFSKQNEIRVDIATGDYASLYSRLKRRSLLMFLGVFLVGSLLSAGLARRFTRPLRRLDTALARLSEGRLDVEVDEAGPAELGRLAGAFNAMTRKLRSHQQRERELTRREKQASLGRLAAGVAHDVRNPLHAIGLTLQHLSETARPRDDARAAEFDRSLELIREEIHRLDRLVANFLRFARSEPRERRPVELEPLLAETLELVAREAGRQGVETALVVEQAPPAVQADAEALRSAVLNLVLNSLEAMPEGGRLEIGLDRDPHNALLTVADTGAGVPEAEQERVFEFAYTTREGGHGLGLALVWQTVVEDHGGKVSLDSRPGEGTRVRLSLPLGEAS